MAVEKINKECVFFLTPKKVQFILSSDVTDGIQVWSSANVVRDSYILFV